MLRIKFGTRGGNWRGQEEPVDLALLKGIAEGCNTACDQPATSIGVSKNGGTGELDRF